MDFAFVTALIFILWLAAKKTKKLLKRLEPEEKLARREMIVIKHSLDGVLMTHLIDPVETPAAEPETRFEVEEEPAAADTGQEFSWEPAEEAELSVG